MGLGTVVGLTRRPEGAMASSEGGRRQELRRHPNCFYKAPKSLKLPENDLEQLCISEGAKIVEPPKKNSLDLLLVGGAFPEIRTNNDQGSRIDKVGSYGVDEARPPSKQPAIYWSCLLYQIIPNA